MNAVKGFFLSRTADLKAAQVMLIQSWHSKCLPATNELTLGRILTPLALLVVLNFMLSLSTSNGR